MVGFSSVKLINKPDVEVSFVEGSVAIVLLFV